MGGGQRRAGEEADNEGLFGTYTKCEDNTSVMEDLPPNCWGNTVKDNPAGEIEEI